MKKEKKAYSNRFCPPSKPAFLRLATTWTMALFVMFSAAAQTNQWLPAQEMKQDFRKARSFNISYKKDSALYYAATLIRTLEELGRLETPFGIRARLEYAHALDLNRQGGDMMEYLLDVRESSMKQKVWDVYVESSLLIALAHEERDQPDKSLENMLLAKSAIERNQVDSMYPFFTIQMASYHRVFSHNVDSSIHYAKETLRTAPLYDLPLKKAWGHMLMGMLLRDTEEERALRHFGDAARLFLSIDDQKGYEAVYANLTRIYQQNGQLQQALAYNDTTLAILQRAIDRGYISHELMYRPFKTRAAIYHDLGRHDSAYYYLDKALDMELAYFHQEEMARINEIDARYNDEKRVQQIQEQALQLELEKTRRNGLLAMALITLLSLSILAFYFIRLRKANQKNRDQAEQLKNRDTSKSRFFANVSHELRTPLSLILGPLVTVLKRGQLEKKDQQLLLMARQGGQNLQLLVNEILDLGKMESGKMELNQEPVHLADFFTYYFAQFESLGYQHGVFYGYENGVSKYVTVLLDREKCRQIIYNLLSNAFKFTPQGGRVHANLKLEGDQLHLSISDTGKGIHPDDLPHVFDRYFQTNRPDAPATGGTGIGLALCKEYARLFGGDISVESKTGKGTSFTVEFPVELVENIDPEEDLSNKLALGFKSVKEKPDQFALPATAANSVVPDAQKPTILVVEDNPELQAYIQIVLQEHYQVTVAENGQAALHHLRSGGLPELIISDLMMPVMDGYQLLKQLKSDPATQQLPVIMLTARAEKDDRLKALRIGVDDYLTKPFDEEELLARINNLLTNQTMRKEAVREEQQEIGTVQPGISTEDQQWLDSFESYLEKHLSNNHLSVLTIADEFAMSQSTLLRQLKRLTGLTPQKFLQEMRLEKARQIMAERRYSSIGRVAQEVGYGDVRNFSKSFKNRFGKTPTEYIDN